MYFIEKVIPPINIVTGRLNAKEPVIPANEIVYSGYITIKIYKN